MVRLLPEHHFRKITKVPTIRDNSGIGRQLSSQHAGLNGTRDGWQNGLHRRAESVVHQSLNIGRIVANHIVG